MSKQKTTFLLGEGDRWFERNQQALSLRSFANDEVVKAIKELKLPINNILEIGCADGSRLDYLNRVMGFQCTGVDVSFSAIESGCRSFPNIKLEVCPADNLNFDNSLFNVVIIGFCLYLCDREDLFTIAKEVDRVLSDNGVVIINDFHPLQPYKKAYVHSDEVYSFKMDYSLLFTWNPIYTKIYQKIYNHDGTNNIQSIDDRISVVTLHKSIDNAFPLKDC